MIIKKNKYNNEVSIDMDMDEAEHVMHIIWFGLDFEEKEKRMSEAEKDLANKMLDVFKQIVMKDEEWQI